MCSSPSLGYDNKTKRFSMFIHHFGMLFLLKGSSDAHFPQVDNENLNENL